MSRPQVLKLLLLAGPLCLMPLQGQDYSKFTMNMGGGITTPLNPTGAYAGVSGNFVMGAGYNINKGSAVVADFMWAGLPSNLFVVQLPKAPTSEINLYSLTVNYRRQFDRISGSAFGVYIMGGGGWYHRYATLQQDFVVPPATPCLPYWTWWGYSCVDGVIYSETVAKKGVNAGGFNGGVGFTIRLADSNIRFFTEARYHYAFHDRIPSTMVPVTFGFRYN